MRSRALQALGTAAVLGGAAFAYGSVAERDWFALRRYDVPVLPAGAAPLPGLHIPHAHLTPGRPPPACWRRSLRPARRAASPEPVWPRVPVRSPRFPLQVVPSPGVFLPYAFELL